MGQIQRPAQQHPEDAFDNVLGAGRGLSAPQHAERIQRIGAADEPKAFTVLGADGEIQVSYYLDNDPKAAILHREDGPARTIRAADGTKTESYYLHGRLHRERDPAVISTRAEDGQDSPVVFRFEEHYRHGLLHREIGPARTIYSDDVRRVEYYRDGELVSAGEPGHGRR